MKKYKIQKSPFIVPTNDGNIIEGATVTLTDTDGATAFSGVSNADGYAAAESGAFTAVTASDMTDDTKSWAVNQWRYNEIYVTSGAGVNERKYIRPTASTSTYLWLAPDFGTTPSIGDRYIMIPYITAIELSPIALTPSSSVWSAVSVKNPFVLNISKPGFETYTSILTLTKAFNSVIKLPRLFIVVEV